MILIPMAALRKPFVVHLRRLPCANTSLGGAGLASKTGARWIVQRAFASASSAKRHRSQDWGGVGVRKRMVPLIKLVHPDLFAQYPPEVAETNQKSLKDLNTLIDAAETLETAAAKANGDVVNGGHGSTASPPAVDPLYRLMFFHHGNGNPLPGDFSSGSLTELEAELRFPPVLSRDPASSLLGQLRRQLAELIRRVPGESAGKGREDSGNGGDDDESFLGLDFEGFNGKGEGWRAADGDEASRAGFSRGWGAPRRSGIRTERESAKGSRPGGPRTLEELHAMVLEHAGDHVFGSGARSSGLGAGFFDGGLGDLKRTKGSRHRPSQNSRGSDWGRHQSRVAEAAFEEKSRQVDDLLRSGRVQFAGIPIAREAEALVRLHRALVSNFDHLELHDRGLWSTVILVVRGRSKDYEVQAHTGGPILIVPEEFSEKHLVRFLGETLLSYG